MWWVLLKGLKWLKPFMTYVCLQWLFLRKRVKAFSSLWAICRCVIANMKGILCNLCIPQLSIGWQYWPICWSRLLYWLTCWSICRLTLDCVSANRYVSQYTGQHSANAGSAKCRWNIARLSVEYRSTIGGISVNCDSYNTCILKSE